MKLILLVSVIALFNLSSEVFCQETSLKRTELRSTKVESSKEFNPYKKDYFYETEKVLKFFKSGSIPADFPKATFFSSAKDYKKAVMGYASMHYDLFNHDELAKRDIVIKKYNDNNVNSDFDSKFKKPNYVKTIDPEYEKKHNK